MRNFIQGFVRTNPWASKVIIKMLLTVVYLIINIHRSDI